MKIENIDSVQMNNGGHFSFMEKQISHLEAYQSVSRKLPPLLTELKTKFNVESEHLKTFQKNPLTSKVAAADKKRDKLYSGMVTTVRGFRNHPSAEKVDSGATLEQVFKEYRIRTSGQVDKETGLMGNLLDDLLGQFAPQVKLLGLGDYVKALLAANEEFKSLSAERLQQQSHVVVGALRTARKATDAAYKQIVAMVNSLIMVEGEDNYRELVLLMNAEVLHAKRQVLGQHAKGNNDPDSVDNDNNHGGDDGDDVPQG
ncbi:MAG: DUF6261 family protein [Prevotellaceae bacterium]|jgi:hypothetical protein|nr:DUF6261 family protein [Prevotellaceae bacterium]